MDIRDTTARLRRTFHYPTDDSSNGGTPEVLDEEEQEDLIQSLAEQNASTNQQYQILLLALPLLASIPYLLALFRPATFLIALLGLTSLASTAFLLFNLPLAETGIPPLDAWAVRSSSSSSAATANYLDDNAASGGGGGGGDQMMSGLGALNQRRQRRRRRMSRTTDSLGGASSYAMPKSPLEKFLPFLNLGLCAILILSGILAARGDGADENNGGGGGGGKSGGHHSHHTASQFGWLGLGNLPAIVYGVVIVAKMVMASVDPERELNALRYEYKGA